jgi:hypothetical protein
MTSPHLGPKTRFLLLSDGCGFVDVGRPFWWEEGSVFPTAAGPRLCSHARALVPWDSGPYFTVSESRLPQPGGPDPRIYIPQEQGGPVIPPGTCFPFRRLLRLAGLRCRYSNPHPHGQSATPNLSCLQHLDTDRTEDAVLLLLFTARKRPSKGRCVAAYFTAFV